MGQLQAFDLCVSGHSTIGVNSGRKLILSANAGERTSARVTGFQGVENALQAHCYNVRFYYTIFVTD